MTEPIEQGEDMLHALMLKMRARDIVSAEEEAVLREAMLEVQEIRPGKIVVKGDTTLSVCTLLIEGHICRYKDLADGQRQIMELHVAGDLFDLHSFLLKRLEHNVASLTAVKIAQVPHEALRRISEDHPHLSRLLWFSTLLDASIQRERILSVGRRSALSRIAHLLCELYMRLDIVGHADGLSYPLPLTQADIADATGLTPVHVNRMLKQLRDQELVVFRGGRVTIQDWERLQKVAEFDPGYLYLERRPR